MPRNQARLLSPGESKSAQEPQKLPCVLATSSLGSGDAVRVAEVAGIGKGVVSRLKFVRLTLLVGLHRRQLRAQLLASP